MLGNKDAIATLAVRDLAAAKQFYEGALGLKLVATEGPEVLVFRSGNAHVNVYRSGFAGSNQATAVTWVVGDELEALVRALKAKGVRFEQYDIPGMTRTGDIHLCGKIKAAWFKDPDGNILSLVSG